MRNGDFVLEDGFFRPNDASFVYRCLSQTQLDHLEVYLDESYPVSSFQLAFHLLRPSNLLSVSVNIVSKDPVSHSRTSEEVGAAQSLWERLLGLPTVKDPSMIDVWHTDDSLAPRIVAETRHRDVFASFRSVAKRRHKRQGDEADGSNDQGENGKKGDQNDEDGDDDEDDAAQDADGDGDDLNRGGGHKKKRKRAPADASENDESVAPVSPDTHVNSPDTSGPIVRMTFPNDPDLDLSAAVEVQLYKRKRGRSKSKQAGPTLAVTFGASNNTANGFVKEEKYALTTVGMSKSPILYSANAKSSQQLPSRNGNIHPTAKSDSKPTLSVAVSLVESLSHNEQQEVLDERPVKSHPLLQALQDYVDNETKVKLEEESSRQQLPKDKLVPNAEAYMPAKTWVPRRLSVNDATSRYLNLQLLSEQFKHWRSEYKNLQYPTKRSSRRQAKTRQRQLVVDFSEANLAEWSFQNALMKQKDEQHEIRDQELAIGIQMAVSDAMVGWRNGGSSSWSVGQRDSGVNYVAPSQEKRAIATQLQPLFEEWANSWKGSTADAVTEDGEHEELAGGEWMRIDDYLRALTTLPTSENPDGATEARIRFLPIDSATSNLCVATAESNYEIAPSTLSEYLLRNLHPISAPKPIDYVVVCPHSPSQWLGTLALSYLTSFRSMYAQCYMGDVCPVDLASLASNKHASVDNANATLLVDCALSTADAFANFRAAGELLRPAIAQVSKKQAFARSPVATVVFLVVPFRRQDAKHKFWSLGAFARGLFGLDKLRDAELPPSSESVTIELLYLDDLFEAELSPCPHTVMANCFALFDRVGEKVNLTPIATTPDKISDVARTRVVCERLYCVANWRHHQKPLTPGSAAATDAAATYVYGGYSVSEDGKWLLAACTDSVGSLLEASAISLDGTDLCDGLVRMMEKLLSFLTLFGEQSVLVVTRLTHPGSRDNCLPENERIAWDTVRSGHLASLVPKDAQGGSLVSRVLLAVLTAVPCADFQLRENEATGLVVGRRCGLMVLSAESSLSRQHASRAISSFPSCANAHAKEPSVLQLSIEQDLLGPAETSSDSDFAPAIEAILRDFTGLSFLTTHPVTGDRQSPLPLHLAIVANLHAELSCLNVQLKTDPLLQHLQ